MRYTINIDDRIRIKELGEACHIPVAIKFSGPVNETSASKFCDEMAHAEDLCLKSKQEVLPIIIDSYGGDVYAMMSMIDMIHGCKVKVATIAEGKAMSCGAFLLSCGADGYRFAGPSATIMIHEVSSMQWGKNEEVKANAVETDRLNDKAFKMMAKNCGKKPDYFMDLVHQKKHADWFLDAEECLKHNLVNHIGIPSFEVNITMTHKFLLPEGR